MPLFDFLCLANSVKLRGRCIAGIRMDGGGWIRPYARTAHGELYPTHYRLQDGSSPRVLDIIRVACERPEPSAHQPENWLIGDEPWRLLHRGMPATATPVLRESLARGPELLGDRARSISFERLRGTPAASSLAVVAPPELRLSIECAPGNAKKARARFRLHGAYYNLPVTDDAWLDRFRALPIGVHPISACGIEAGAKVLLTISLSEPFEDGRCYKLVAAIIPVARASSPHGNAGKAWDDVEEMLLIDEFDAGLPMAEIARRHGRTAGAIQARLIKVGKVDG